MKFAIPVWGESLSTVCDFCDTWLLVETMPQGPHTRELLDLHRFGFIERVEMLKSKEVGILLCGAISKTLEDWVRAAGIEIIPYLRGKTEDVLDAYLDDRLFDQRYFLPGCRRQASCARRRQRLRAGRHIME